MRVSGPAAFQHGEVVAHDIKGEHRVIGNMSDALEVVAISVRLNGDRGVRDCGTIKTTQTFDMSASGVGGGEGPQMSFHLPGVVMVFLKVTG